MCVIDPVPRAASIRALTPVRAIEIKAATLHHLYQQLPDQYAIVLLNLARGVQLFGGERDLTHSGRRTVFGLQLQF